MYLKYMVMQGFKSFCDKTVFNFVDNINGIVGPNGSGKSNVVDAVRFVLGEQSSKNLRGEGNMTDVIFSGSKSRKGASFASVTLIFDNTDHHLNTSYDEVSIKRVIYKNGESEYYLNKERCRLKDITDLMMDSSASRESFNIISQGKISDILSGRAIDRRLILEEAAGVLKYKRRKEEALRKLDRTNANINRVSDIISELDAQLKPLKEEALKAKEYISLKDELTSLEVALIASDVVSLNNEYQALNDKKELLTDSIIKIEKDSNNSFIEIEKLKKKEEELSKAILVSQDEVLKKTLEQEKLNTELKLLKERNKYQLSSDDVNIRKFSLKEDILACENDINNVKMEISSGKEELGKLDVIYKDLTSKYEDLKNKLFNTNREIDKCNRLGTDYEYQINNLENLINNNETLPSSVRSVLNNPKFKGVHNVIGALVNTDSKYSTSLSIALSSSSNYIVVDNAKCASLCINYLKEHNLGRATFYPIDTIKGRFIPKDVIDILNGCDNYLGILLDLVSYDKKYEGVIARELGSTIVAKDLDSANIISKKIDYKYRIVTLDGQVVNAGGSLVGGSIRDKGSVVKLKADLANLNNLVIRNNDRLSYLEEELGKLEEVMYDVDSKIHKNRASYLVVSDSISSKEELFNKLSVNLNSLNMEYNTINRDNKSEEDKLFMNISECGNKLSELKNNLKNLLFDKNMVSDSIRDMESESKKNNALIAKNNKELNDISITLLKVEGKLDNYLNYLNEEYNLTFEGAKDKYSLDMDSEIARSRVNAIKSRIKDMGEVYTLFIDEYEKVNERYSFLCSQREELHSAENTLLEIINEMDCVMKDKFITTFDSVNEEFDKVFKLLFGGGKARLKLTDPDNILETGVDIEAIPAGKSLKSISLLSGGEKTLTAIALLFAILNVRPVPFCILDEVEAALDEANVDRFGKYLELYRDKTQFILITHKKKTMEYADILYGITMQESGVSKLVSVKLDDIK